MASDKSFNRFDFEQQIMECWRVTNDIEDLCDGVMNRNLDRDQIANILLGVRALYDLRFEELFRQFEQMVREHARHLDRDYKAVDEFNAEQIRKFHEAQQELPF